jgi:hypothetical protein
MRRAAAPPCRPVRRPAAGFTGVVRVAGVIAGVVVVVAGVVVAGGGVPAAHRLLGNLEVTRAMAGPSLSLTGVLSASAEPLAGGGMAGRQDPSQSPGISAGPGVPETPATGTPSPSVPALLATLTPADRTAGVLRSVVPRRGTGRLGVVPGSGPAPGADSVKRVRVEVEGGLPVDGPAFAAFVLATLNDPRSWGHGGRMTFARTGGAYDIRVVLASPDTSARLCAPLQTMGTLSCGQGRTAVLTLYRWVKAIPDYGTDRTGYRRYLVNHEVGHTLGHGHEVCPGAGRPAPVMMQQTKGLKGCRPNSWPFP